MSEGVYVKLDGQGNVMAEFSAQQEPPVTFWAVGTPHHTAWLLRKAIPKRLEELAAVYQSKISTGFAFNDGEAPKVAGLTTERMQVIMGLRSSSCLRR